MAKYLINTTETYRVSTEAEAEKLIEEAKKDNHFILGKYSSQYKERKAKGEVIDTWYKVTLIKDFTEEKDPVFDTEITYTNSMESAF